MEATIKIEGVELIVDFYRDEFSIDFNSIHLGEIDITEIFDWDRHEQRLKDLCFEYDSGHEELIRRFFEEEMNIEDLPQDLDATVKELTEYLKPHLKEQSGLDLNKIEKDIDNSLRELSAEEFLNWKGVDPYQFISSSELLEGDNLPNLLREYAQQVRGEELTDKDVVFEVDCILSELEDLAHGRESELIAEARQKLSQTKKD